MKPVWIPPFALHLAALAALMSGDAMDWYTGMTNQIEFLLKILPQKPPSVFQR